MNVVALTADYGIISVDTDTNTVIQTFQVQAEDIYIGCLCFNKCGSLLAATRNKTLRNPFRSSIVSIFDVSNGTESYNIKRNSNVVAISFNARSDCLVCRSLGGHIFIWNFDIATVTHNISNFRQRPNATCMFCVKDDDQS